MAIVASDERRSSSVRFLLYVFILLSAEKDLSIDALLWRVQSESAEASLLPRGQFALNRSGARN